MVDHIGIVACSAEGAALCYRTICIAGAQLLGAHAHPEVSIHSHSLAEYVKCLDRNDWQGVGELMLSSANKLAQIGADFLICPDNTIHQALPYVQSRSPLPWLHIAEVVAATAVERGFKYLGLNQGCDAVVLGCTEIPLIMNDENSPLPTLDSTRLLARAALRRAVQRATPQA